MDRSGGSTQASGHSARRGRTGGLYYGWVIVGVSFTTMAFHMAATFSFSLFQVPLIQEFGWSRGALGGAFALSMSLYAICSPTAGSLLERKGPRALIPWGSALIGAGLALGFFISSLWHAYIFIGVMIGIGLALSGFVTHNAILPRWFFRSRGLAAGIAISGIGIGSFILMPTIERIIAVFGWRYAYLIFGGSILLLLLPLKILLLRNNPSDVGQNIDGVSDAEAANIPKPTASHSQKVGAVFWQVKGERNFWALMILAFVIGLNNNSIWSQLQIFFVDAKFSTAFGAFVFGLTGAIRILGSVVLGWASDRIARKKAQAIALFLGGLGVLVLLSVPNMSYGAALAFSFAAIYGFGVGGMSTCYAAMCADAYAGRSFAVIMGLLEIAFGLGGFIGPPMAGFMFDFTGSYVLPFCIVVIFQAVALLVCQFVYSTER
ncbi:MAG: MFS transporter [Nitrospinae bacterium]|nr:MFS transporter [Nitrospinota bacterium]